jgi:hypothetical protein
MCVIAILRNYVREMYAIWVQARLEGFENICYAPKKYIRHTQK